MRTTFDPPPIHWSILAREMGLPETSFTAVQRALALVGWTLVP